MNRNYRAKMMMLNVGRFAGLGVSNVPKRPRDSARMHVPKRHALRADFFDFETETGKNIHRCLSQNKNLTTRNDKYGYPQP